MFIGQFFKGNPNFEVLETLEAISKVQVYFENDIHMDYDIEWFILTALHVIHVHRPVFQGEFEFRHIRSTRAYLKDLGGPQERRNGSKIPL